MDLSIKIVGYRVFLLGILFFKIRKEKVMYKIWMEAKRFIEEEDAIGTVEMILILVVLIGLVVIFRDQLTTLVNGIFERITTESAGI